MLSKITIHMVSSLDGFIAKNDGDISWMHSTDKFDNGKELTEQEITNFLEGIDCYVMGSRTYEQAVRLGWPYGETPVLVLTSRTLKSDLESVSFMSGDLEKIVNTELRPNYSNIWMVGGAELTRSFIQKRLADEIVVTIVPILLGDGIPFFNKIDVEQLLHLKDVTPFQDGMVEMTYEIKK